MVTATSDTLTACLNPPLHCPTNPPSKPPTRTSPIGQRRMARHQGSGLEEAWDGTNRTNLNHWVITSLAGVLHSHCLPLFRTVRRQTLATNFLSNFGSPKLGLRGSFSTPDCASCRYLKAHLWETWGRPVVRAPVASSLIQWCYFFIPIFYLLVHPPQTSWNVGVKITKPRVDSPSSVATWQNYIATFLLVELLLCWLFLCTIPLEY